MASTEWADPWACGTCTYQHVEPAEARLAACSICGARRPVGSAAAPPDSKRPAAHGPRDHDGTAAASAKRRRTDAPALSAMAIAPAAEEAYGAERGRALCTRACACARVCACGVMQGQNDRPPAPCNVNPPPTNTFD